MKTASGIIALILGLLSLLNIAGCSKAEKEYDAFISYSNSTQGGLEGFLRGYSRASQGDPFGAVLDLADQEHALIANAKDARWSAWACLIGTAIAAVVCAVLPSRQPAAATTPLASTLPSTPAQAPPVVTPTPTPAPEHTIEERLRTLLQLKESGLITAEEHDARAHQIIEAI